MTRRRPMKRSTTTESPWMSAHSNTGTPSTGRTVTDFTLPCTRALRPGSSAVDAASVSARGVPAAAAGACGSPAAAAGACGSPAAAAGASRCIGLAPRRRDVAGRRLAGRSGDGLHTYERPPELERDDRGRGVRKLADRSGDPVGHAVVQRPHGQPRVGGPRQQDRDLGLPVPRDLGSQVQCRAHHPPVGDVDHLQAGCRRGRASSRRPRVVRPPPRPS